MIDVSLALQIVILAVVAGWGILQVRLTKSLEREIGRLNLQLDQKIQLLYRAREAAIKKHGAEVFLLNWKAAELPASEEAVRMFSEFSSYSAELRGLAFAIDDKELLSLVNKGSDFNLSEFNASERLLYSEMELRNQFQHIHTRIAKLLEKTTNVEKYTSNLLL